MVLKRALNNDLRVEVNPTQTLQPPKKNTKTSKSEIRNTYTKLTRYTYINLAELYIGLHKKDINKKKQSVIRL